MSAVIGALRVDLGMNSASFRMGASDAERRVSKMRTQFVMLSAVAAAAGAALAAAVGSGLRDIDRQAKAARSIDGTTTALRALEIAGSDAGVGQAKLIKAAQSMGREIANAGFESGLARDALDRLGLSAKALGDMDADQRLATVADRIKELGYSSGETMDALRDLGVTNRDVALLFVQGGDAIRAARTEVEDLGLALDQNAVKKVEEANDALSRISFAFEAFRNQIAVGAAPALKLLADGFVASLKEGGALRGMIDGLASNIARIVTTVGVAVAAFGTRYVLALVAARLATFSFAGSLIAVRTALIRTGIGALIIGAGELVFQFGKLASGAGGFGAALGLLKDVAAEVWERMKLGARSMGASLSAVAETIQASFLSAFAWIAEKFRDLMALVTGPVNSALEAIGSSSRIGEVGEEIASGLRQASESAYEASRLFGEAAGVFAREAKAPLKSLEALRAASKDVGDSAEDGLGRATAAASNFGDALADLGSGSSGGGVGALEDVADAVAEIDGAFDKLIDRLARGDIVGGIKGLFDDIRTAGSNAFSGLLKDAFNGGGLKAITEGLSKAWDGVAQGVSSLFSGGGIGAIGGIISSALPVIGAISGIVSLVQSFSSKEIIGSGLNIGVQDGGLTGGQFETEKKTSFWGLFSKKTTTDSDFTDEQADAFADQLGNVKDAVKNTFEMAGVDVSDALIDGVNLAVQKLDLKGLSQSEIEDKINAVFVEYGDALSDAIGGVTLEVAGIFAQVKSLLEPVGQAFLGTFKDMALAAEELAKIAGGTDALGQKVQAFADLFLTDQEKLDAMTNSISSTFQRLGLEIPDTNDAFKKLVLSQNLMTESGRETYNALLDIAPVFNAASNAITDAATQTIGATDALVKGLGASFDLSGGNFVSEFDDRLAQIAKARGYDVTQDIYSDAGRREFGPLSDLNDSSVAQGRVLQRILNIFERWDIDGLEVRQ